MSERKQHWEQVYQQKADEDTSWFQPKPETSLQLIQASGLNPEQAALIDVGGGSSRLVDHLLASGWQHLSVLDIAAAALKRSQQRLGKHAQQVHWLEQDILAQPLPQSYQLWHDRALFHFLVDEADRQAYLEQLNRHLSPGGFVIIAAFDLDGPTECSQLPVQRYSSQTLADVLGQNYQLKQSLTEQHRTYSGKIQSFIYTLFQKQ